MLPQGWWSGKEGGLEFQAGLYSIRQTRVGEQIPSFDWLANMGHCDSETSGSAVCRDRIAVARSSLTLQLAGFAGAFTLWVAAAVLDTARRMPAVLHCCVMSLLYMAPLIIFCGLLQFSYMLVDLEKSWIHVGPAYLAAVLLTPLTTAPVFFVPPAMKEADAQERKRASVLEADPRSRRRLLNQLHMYGSIAQPKVDAEQPPPADAMQAMQTVLTPPPEIWQSLPWREATETKGNKAACPGEHPLMPFMALGQPGDVSQFECDLCEARIVSGTCTYGCRACNYDICLKCKQLHLPPTTSSKIKSSSVKEKKLKAKVNFGDAAVSEYTATKLESYEGRHVSFDLNMETESESDEEAEKRTVVGAQVGSGSGFAAGVMGVLRKVFVGAPTELEGYLWKATKGSLEGTAESFQHIDKWRRRWYKLKLEHDAMILTYLSEKDDGEVEVINTAKGQHEAYTRFEVQTPVTMKYADANEEYEVKFKLSTYQTAFDRQVPYEEEQKLPTTLYPILFAWVEGNMEEVCCISPANAETCNNEVVLREKTMLLACETEEQRLLWMKGVQRMWRGIDHSSKKAGSARKPADSQCLSNVVRQVMTPAQSGDVESQPSAPITESAKTAPARFGFDEGPDTSELLKDA